MLVMQIVHFRFPFVAYKTHATSEYVRTVFAIQYNSGFLSLSFAHFRELHPVSIG